ncbi:MAG TPA: S8/S53 family peptidase [Acidimicrobiales bacterium]|nr:S8/S53 family peptidase [Acidimicrobiales bacterium]
MRPDGNDGKAPDVADIVWDAIVKDGRVAWHESGNSKYLYRPDELLVDTDFELVLGAALEQVGAKRSRCHSREGRLLEGLGLRRYRLAAGRTDARAALDTVRKSVDGIDGAAAAVTLTHVLVGAPVFKFGPGDLPHDGGRGQVEPERSVRPGSGKGVRVSVLDTGFVASSAHQHPLLAQHYVDDGDDVDTLVDDAMHQIRSVFGGHGTFVAGVIRQLAPDTELDPEVTLDEVGVVDDVELALDLLRQRSADIVNLSLAGPSEDDLPPQALTKALTELGKRSRAVYVAAAGNDFEMAKKAGVPERRMWPAAFGGMEGFEHVVGVAAVHGPPDALVAADFTNRGPWVRACAYGVDRRSTYVLGTMPVPPGAIDFPHATATWSGTSFAAPRVAGVIAAAMTSTDPPMPARDALARVLADATPGPDGCGVFVD